MREYYSNKKILEKNAEYNIVLGERSNGKSYCIKMEQCLKIAIKQEKCTFVIIKRLSEDIKAGFIEEYFADMPISKLTKGKYNKVVGYRDGIYLAREDEDEKLVRGLQIGKAMALSNDERYKSRAYPDITDIVFEEFVTNKLYLRDEVKRLMNLVSTILRRRKGRVWLIANTISRICPYFNEWGLRGIPTMKQGGIDLYTVNTATAQVKIAVEYCGNAGEEISGMFFGRFAKSIDGGAWECDEYPKLPEGDISYHYSIGFKYNDFGFIIWLCSLDSDAFLYIKPARTVGDGEFVFPNRILTNEFSISRLISNALNLDVPVECLVSKLYRQGKVCYSHNLCGADFTSCLLNSKIIL